VTSVEAPQARERPTVRVVLLDPADRVLLMRGRLPGSAPGVGAWFTIGGGIEPGETPREAAVREIIEETGFQDVELGPVVWVRTGVLRIPDPALFRESYFIARCPGGEPTRDGWDALERSLIDDIRWWSQAEIAGSAERIFPPGLSTLLPPLLTGTLPPEPLQIPWD
jgi:8-oxo-dGTP diphosphatase